MRKFVSIILLIFAVWLFVSPVIATPEEDLQKQINDLEGKITNSQNQEKTLASQIEVLTSNISLTKLRISQTELKIDSLENNIASVSGKITSIEDSLEFVSKVVTNRIVKSYKASRTDDLLMVVSSTDFSQLWQRLSYLHQVQKSDHDRIIRMAAIRKNLNDQKADSETYKKKMEGLSDELNLQKKQLDKQNLEKQKLLEVTKNDEKIYQQLLTQARQELDSIRTSQYSGRRIVKKGEVIGIMGSTGFSTGPHLHFGVYSLTEDKASSFVYSSSVQNPLDFLKSRSLSVDGGACFDRSGSGNFGNGNWDWPMVNPKVSQCFGRTPYSWVYANGSHDGLDMYDNSDKSVRAVDDGVAFFYRGTSAFGNNVRIFHSNGKMSLYLHLQ